MTRPTYLEVDLSALKNNVQAIRQRVSPAMVCVMLKANAYGHGVEGVAPFIEPYVDMIGVAILEEGVCLREIGIKKPILVAGGAFVDQIPTYAENDLRITISSYEVLRAAEDYGKKTNKHPYAHIKIDTGMQRSGIRWYEAEEFLAETARCSHVNFEGIYTHFANSEYVEGDEQGIERSFSTTRQQLDRFKAVLELYKEHGWDVPPIRHTANSGAILNHEEAFFDMVRPGIIFYGILPGEECKPTVTVKPAARWVSKIVYKKTIRAADPVSYSSLWSADSARNIATIPCGYGDGYFRNLTNLSEIFVNGKRKKQVGRICMDQFVVDLGDDDANVGDEVILLGLDPVSGERINADDLAALLGTNGYEIMTNIAARVPRVFKQN